MTDRRGMSLRPRELPVVVEHPACGLHLRGAVLFRHQAWPRLPTLSARDGFLPGSRWDPRGAVLSLLSARRRPRVLETLSLYGACGQGAEVGLASSYSENFAPPLNIVAG